MQKTLVRIMKDAHTLVLQDSEKKLQHELIQHLVIIANAIAIFNSFIYTKETNFTYNHEYVSKAQ